MNGPRDLELEELFEEPELRDFAQLLRSAPHPAAHVDPSPAFRMALRRQLVQEGWRQILPAPVPWYRRLLSPPVVAWAGATVGALLIAVAAFTFATGTHGTTTTTLTVVSPLNDSQQVSVVKPIELQFSQPMDHQSVQEAVQIRPVVAVTWQWQGDDRTVRIVPVNNLAPNTLYQVTVAPSARTEGGRQLGKVAAFAFATAGPSPAPSPRPSPTASTTPVPALGGERQLAPAGPPAARWSPDGSVLYVIGPSGQLQAWPVAGGTPRTVAPDGVGMVAVAPDGPAYVRGGQIVYGQVTIAGAQPLALGFHGGEVTWVTARGVEQGTGRARLASLTEEAQTADFSPAGDRVAYRSTSGNLHVVDLGSGKDVEVGPAAGAGDWSPDGRRYAYATDGGVYVTDGTAPSRLADVAGTTSLSWSSGNQLLLATTSSLLLVNVGDGSGPRALATGSFDQLDWSPAAGGTFAFKRAGAVWLEQVTGMAQSAAGAAAASQADIVTRFMDARRAQQADMAAAFLDQAGRDAFGRLNDLVFPGPTTFARYYVLLSQPGRAVVRLVLVQGTTQSALDQTLTFAKDASGALVIHDARETPRAAFGSGPEVTKVVVSPGQVQVTFDSDLSAGTVAAGVGIKGVAAQVSYDARSRTVTLTVPGGLTAGATYDLEVSGGLLDVGPRQAAAYELPFTGPQGS